MRRALSFAAVAVFTLVASTSAFALPNDKFQGKPKFTAGGSLGAYVWHDGDGHHVRFTTVANKVVRRFHGKVCGKDVTAVKAVRTEVGDGVKVGPKGHCVMFDFKTNAGLDGFDLRMPDGAVITYDFEIDGKQLAPKLIRIGTKGVNPPHSPFKLQR